MNLNRIFLPTLICMLGFNTGLFCDKGDLFDQFGRRLSDLLVPLTEEDLTANELAAAVAEEELGLVEMGFNAGGDRVEEGVLVGNNPINNDLETQNRVGGGVVVNQTNDQQGDQQGDQPNDAGITVIRIMPRPDWRVFNNDPTTTNDGRGVVRPREAREEEDGGTPSARRRRTEDAPNSPITEGFRLNSTPVTPRDLISSPNTGFDWVSGSFSPDDQTQGAVDNNKRPNNGSNNGAPTSKKIKLKVSPLSCRILFEEPESDDSKRDDEDDDFDGSGPPPSLLSFGSESGSGFF